MMQVLVNEEVYVECIKCGKYKKPISFGKKGKKRKSCGTCRKRK